MAVVVDEERDGEQGDLVGGEVGDEEEGEVVVAVVVCGIVAIGVGVAGATVLEGLQGLAELAVLGLVGTAAKRDGCGAGWGMFLAPVRLVGGFLRCGHVRKRRRRRRREGVGDKKKSEQTRVVLDVDDGEV